MKFHSKRRCRSQRTSYLRLEPLEDRLYLSLAFMSEAGVLSILGDRADDRLAIADDGHGNITVDEPAGSHSFERIQQIVLNTNGGNDTAVYRLGDRWHQPVDLQVDMGTGNDDLRLIYGFNPQPDPPGGDPFHPSVVTVNLGAGNDVMISEENDFPVPLQLNVLAGAGNDDVRLISSFNPQPDPPGEPFGLRDIAVDLGAGNDVMISDENNTPAPLKLNVMAGAGNDDVRLMSSFNPQPDPPGEPFGLRDITVDLGAGNDVMISDENDTPAPLTLKVLGQQGNDALRMAIGDPEVSDPLVLAREIAVNFDGGNGDDNAIIIIGGNVALDGRLTSVLNMGAGNDHVTLESAAPFLVDSFFDIIVDLADGNDLLSAKFSLPDAREMQVAGKLQLKALGGRGNDSLALDFTNVPLLDVTADLGMGSNVLSVGDLISLPGTGAPFDPGNPIVAGQHKISAHGGSGTDRVSLNLTSRPLLDVFVDLGSGDDWLSTQISATDALETPVGGEQRIQVFGGNGNDRLNLQIGDPDIRDPLLLGGSLAVMLDGGVGNDNVDAVFWLAAESEGLLTADVLGGLGDDTLSLIALGGPDTRSGLGSELFALFLDGGKGFDIARATRNVRVENCEDVTFVG